MNPDDPESRSRSPSFYVDCTATYVGRLNTGISRVVRNLLGRTDTASLAVKQQIFPVVVREGRPHRVSCSAFLTGGQGRHPFPTRLKGGLERLRARLARLPWLGRAFSQGIHLLIEALRPFLRLYKRTRLAAIKTDAESVITLSEKDCFIFLDAFWAYNVGAAFKEAKKAGTVITVIYDLIPLSHPEMVEPSLTQAFEENLRAACEVSNGFICISESVAVSLREYLEKNYLFREGIEIRHFRLGADFRQQRTIQNLSVRPGLADLMREPHVWLMVGTIEPRKNHLKVAEALIEVCEKNPYFKLAIIGRVGWRAEGILDGLLHHPLYGRNLFVYNDIDDEELDYCYDRAQGLVMASLIEGFGLPVVEALRSGLKVACSDIPIFREVAGSAASYFDPLSSNSIAACLLAAGEGEQKTGSDVATQLKATGFEPTDWDTSTREFFATAAEIHFAHLRQRGIRAPMDMASIVPSPTLA